VPAVKEEGKEKEEKVETAKKGSKEVKMTKFQF
jgi:hypothetical protein